MAAYLECLPAAAQQAIRMPLPPGIPFTVLSAASALDREVRERDGWVHASTDGKHIRVEESTHWIPIERPEIVVEAIRDVVLRARL